MTEQPTPVDPDGIPPEKADATHDHALQPNTRTPFFQAIHAARYQRQAMIKQIQACTERQLICYVSGRNCGIDDDDTIPFVDLLHHVRRGEDVDLLLHTTGGSVDVAEKLIRMVRSTVGEAEFRIIVPNFAKSAGTLMVLGADRVVMSDMSELGPIDPQVIFADSSGLRRWQSVQNYLDAYDEHTNAINQNPSNVAAQIMLGKLDAAIVKMCQAVKGRARQSAEHLLQGGMFLNGRGNNGGNSTKTAYELLDTTRWRSHAQMISWEDARSPNIGLEVEYLKPQSEQWQGYWSLYCLQSLAVGDGQKLYESDYASVVIDGLTG